MKYFAYLDPGTGSVFIQAIIGVILAGVVAFRSFFVRASGKVRQLFARKQVGNEEDNEG